LCLYWQNTRSSFQWFCTMFYFLSFLIGMQQYVEKVHMLGHLKRCEYFRKFFWLVNLSWDELTVDEQTNHRTHHLRIYTLTNHCYLLFKFLKPVPKTNVNLWQIVRQSWLRLERALRVRCLHTEFCCHIFGTCTVCMTWF